MPYSRSFSRSGLTLRLRQNEQASVARRRERFEREARSREASFPRLESMSLGTIQREWYDEKREEVDDGRSCWRRQREGKSLPVQVTRGKSHGNALWGNWGYPHSKPPFPAVNLHSSSNATLLRLVSPISLAYLRKLDTCVLRNT